MSPVDQVLITAFLSTMRPSALLSWFAVVPGLLILAFTAARAGDAQGLVVVVPARDPAALVARGRDSTALIHGLVRTDAEAAAIRTAADAAGLTGLVNADRWIDLRRLPFVDWQLTRLEIDADALGKDAPSDAEIQRVLAVNGTAVITRGGAATTVRKAMDPRMREWTHVGFSDSSGNILSKDALVEPVNGIQWINGPTLNQGSQHFLIHDGRAYVYLTEFSYQGVRHRESSRIWCFDAGSGEPLWRLEDDDAPIVVDDGLLLTARPRDRLMQVRSATSGALIATFADSIPLSEYGGGFNKYDAWWTALVVSHYAPTYFIDYSNVSYDRGQVAQWWGKDLAMFDARTGRAQWRKTATDGTFAVARLVDGVLYVLHGEDRPYMRTSGPDVAFFRGRAVSAFDAKDGRQLWRNEDAMKGITTQSMVVEAGRVVFAGILGRIKSNDDKAAERIPPPSLVTLDAKTGRTILRKVGERELGIDTLIGDHLKARRNNFDMNFSAIGVDGDVVRGLAFNAATHFNVTTGAVVAPGISFLGGGMGICMRITATQRFSIGPGNWFVGFGAEQPATMGKRSIQRPACQRPSIPALGMIFSTTAPQDFNGAHIHPGQMALFGRDPQPETPDAMRLVPGPGKAPGTRDAYRNAWPVFHGDARRGNSTEGAGPARLAKGWEVALAKPHDFSVRNLNRYQWSMNHRSPRGLTAPTAGGGLVFVAESESGMLYALDQKDGSTRWSARLGGRIHAPPTLADGLAITSCQDGWVHAHVMATGQEAWRFLAGRTPNRIVHIGQLEASSPALQSPLVLDGKVWVISGRHSIADGGATLWVLDLATGKPAAKLPVGKEHCRGWWEDGVERIDMLQTDLAGKQVGSGSITADIATLRLGVRKLEGERRTRRTVYDFGAGVANRGAMVAFGMHPDFYSRSGQSCWQSQRRIDMMRSLGVMVYDKLGAERIAITPEAVYGFGPRNRKTEGTGPKGDLVLRRYNQDATGKLAEGAPAWLMSADISHGGLKAIGSQDWNLQAQALVAAKDHLLLVGLDEKLDSYVDRYAKADGKRDAGLRIPGQITDNGIAIDGARAFVTTTDGRVIAIE